MKKALLDTNIISYFLRGNQRVIENLRIYRQYYSYLSFSVFTYYEIRGGLLYADAKKQMSGFDRLSESSEIIPFDVEIADIASEVYSNLRARGLFISPIDLFIGSTALYYDYRLITANTKHFQNIVSLEYEDWSK